MHGIGFVEQNLFLAYVMLNKPIPGIRYVRQNLFLAYVMFDKTYSWHTLCWTKSHMGLKSVKQDVFRVKNNFRN